MVPADASSASCVFGGSSTDVALSLGWAADASSEAEVVLACSKCDGAAGGAGEHACMPLPKADAARCSCLSFSA